MNLTIAIPDDIASRFGSAIELERRALEALALEGYLTARMSRAEMQGLLGLADEVELDSFLQTHGMKVTSALHDGTDDFTADELVARFKTFAAQHTLGGLALKDLISQGRR